jgi:hypothetical protein
MNSNDLEDQLYLAYSNIPFECPYCQAMLSYRQMPPPGYPPQSGGGGMGGQTSMPPMGPPPSLTPSEHQMKAQPKAVEPGAIKPCTYRYIYIYPRRGRGYWAWLTYVGRKSASGYRWTGHNWVYFGIDLRQINSFYCY